MTGEKIWVTDAWGLRPFFLQIFHTFLNTCWIFIPIYRVSAWEASWNYCNIYLHHLNIVNFHPWSLIIKWLTIKKTVAAHFLWKWFECFGSFNYFQWHYSSLPSHHSSILEFLIKAFIEYCVTVRVRLQNNWCSWITKVSIVISRLRCILFLNMCILSDINDLSRNYLWSRVFQLQIHFLALKKSLKKHLDRVWDPLKRRSNIQQIFLCIS